MELIIRFWRIEMIKNDLYFELRMCVGNDEAGSV